MGASTRDEENTRMNPSSPTIRLAAMVLVLATAARPAAAAADASPAGRWEGSIALPGMELGVTVELATDERGGWSGKIDIPAQGARGLALGALEVAPPRIRFGIQGIPGEPTFDGQLAEDGNTISGTFHQSGQSFPFRPSRARPAQEQAQSALAEFYVPSVGVAIVRGDEIVLAEGFGLRDVERKLPATADTLYAIGSITKSFTATAIGLLVDEGKLRLDQPVAELLPEFRLHDPLRTLAVTVRDLLAHRTGLPRHDLGWYNAKDSREELVRRLRYLEPSAPLRERWQYQNWMFTTAGYLAGRLAGTSWEELVRARLLAPLGMRRSNFSTRDSTADPDHAEPYVERDRKVERVPFRELPQMGPAGTINSSAREMAAWLGLQLGRGSLSDRRLVQEGTIADLHAGHMVLPEGGPDPEILAPRYGLGWLVDVYRGRRRVSHGGGIDGFTALATFFPDDGVGVVVLANLSGTPVPALVTLIASDRLLGLSEIDWRARILARWQQARDAEQKATAKGEQERRPGTRPPRPLEEYEGEYEHPGYGVIAVRRDGADGLAATLHDLPISLEHWHFETFRGTSPEKVLSDLKLFVQFVSDAAGEITRLEVPLEPLVPAIGFRKRPPARLADPAFLSGLAGEYRFVDMPTVTARVELAGSRLRVTLPAQPTYELEPLRGTEFQLRGLEGYRARFVLDRAGKVSELQFVQPEGVYSAKPED
jgi:CubicO group peptidase (beta-lactamase class C family)